MPKNHSDHGPTSTPTIAIHDIHDIRALTTTGVITLPERPVSPKDGASERS